MKQIFVIVFTLLVIATQAQTFTGNGYNTYFGVLSCSGRVTGYYKNGLKNINGKQKLFRGCNLNTVSTGGNYPSPDSTYITNTNQNSFRVTALMLDNLDSSSNTLCLLGIGYNYATGTENKFFLNRKNTCKPCQIGAGHAFSLYNKYAEYTNDSILISESYYLPYSTVDSATNSVTLYQGNFDVFYDSISLYFRNVEPRGGVPPPAPYTTLNNAQAHYHSRIFRFHDYPNISSPEVTNPQTILALKGKPFTWNPGIIDPDGDSIAVKPMLMRISNSDFHPNGLLSTPTIPCLSPGLSQLQQDTIKKNLVDSSIDILYKPNYSPAQPFGTNAAYSLQPNSGQITFTSPDTGLFLLAYRIEEYRDGQLLGDIMNVRVAVVRDSTGVVLPTISAPQNISGGMYDAATNTLTVCAGTPISFTATGNSALADAQLQASSNALQATPGATLSSSGGGTNSVSFAFSWTPADSNNGFHYLYLDVADTACGTIHLPAHQNSGINIHVISNLHISTQSSICQGDTITLQAVGGYNPLWGTLPGGDPQLQCIQCSWQQLTPDSTTAYVLTRKFGACQSADTTTVTVIRPYTVIARDTSFLNAVPANYVLDATVSPTGNYYIYSWSPAAAVDSPNILHPHPLNPANTNVYVLTVTDSSGCFSAMDTLVLKSNTSGVHTITSTAAPLLRLHPNPAENVLYIDYTSAGSFRLYDLLGRAVLLETLPAGAYSKNISVIDFQAGVYTYRFTDKGGRKVNGKVIINR